MSGPASREPRRLTRWWRRRSLRTRLTVIAATAIAVSVFLAFQVASQLLDWELRDTAENQLRADSRVLTRDMLFEAIWGFDMSATANNLQVYVSYLRRKMEAEGEPRLIYTLRGTGYALRETPP